MARIPLAKQFYAMASMPELSEDLLNFFAEPVPGEGRSTFILRSTAGLQVDLTIGAGPVLAIDGSLPGVLYVVSGTHAYRVNFGVTTVVTDLGSIGAVPPPASTGNPMKVVTIAIGVLAVVICNPPNIYQCLHTASAIVQYTATPISADSVAYSSGYFLFNNGNAIFGSNLLDAATYPALNFIYADSRPNAIFRLFAHNGDVWAMGYAGLEIFYNAGVANFPFVPRSGGDITPGCQNAASVVEAAGSLFWLGSDGVVYRNNGYAPVRISTFAIEDWMRNHGDNENLDACAYTQAGHTFYCLSFTGSTFSPTATLVYDATTQLWHRRASSTDGAGVWRGTRATALGDVPLIGDRLSGAIFQSSPFIPTDNGVQVLRQFILPPLYADTRRGFMPRLELEVEIGYAGVNPIVQLDYSDDGGNSYSGTKPGALQPYGSHKGRVFWTRLGSFRERILRFTFTDRANIYAVDAGLEQGQW